MDPAELEEFRLRQRRVSTLFSWALLGASAAIGLVIAFAWSFLIGLLVACVLGLVSQELHVRWQKARWIRRFPELAAPTTRCRPR